MTIPSPCNRHCTLDGDICIGCRRTLDEIIGWSEASEAEKRAIWERVKKRKEESSFL